MASGTIKHIVADKGYGFIAPDAGGPNLFFHMSELEYGLDFDSQLIERRIEFDIGRDERSGRSRAVTIRAAS